MTKSLMATYVRAYLPPSMTFVHRQLSSMQRYDAMGICRFRWKDSRFADPQGGLAEYWKMVRGLERITTEVKVGERTRLEEMFYEKTLRKHRPELVHAHIADYAYAVSSSALKTNTPLVVTFHGYDASMRLLQPEYRDRYKEVLESASLIITVAESMRDRLIKWGADPNKTAYHYVGIDIPDSPNVERDPNLILQTGRLAGKKGYEVTLRALSLARQSHPELRLLIIGDGPLRQSLEQQVEELGLGEAVTFAGDLPYKEVESALSLASVFVHPSVTTDDGDEEGIPTTIVEAMANGLPVVATRHAGIPEVVVDGTGILAAEHDHVGVAEAIVRLSKDEGLRSAFGESAKKHIRARFDMAKNTAGLEDAYDLVRSGNIRAATERLMS